MDEELSIRHRLLRAGFEMLKDRALGEIRLVDLTRAARTSNGAFYHTWPDGLSGYTRDLTGHAVEAAHMQYLAEMFRELSQIAPSDVPFRDVVRTMAARSSAGIDTDPAFRAQVSLWPEAARDPGVRAELEKQYRKWTAEMYVPTYSHLLDAYQLEVRPPFTIEMMAVALTALTEGLALRRAVDPDEVLPPTSLQTEGWDLFGVLTFALLGTIVRPREGSDIRSGFELIDELLSDDGAMTDETRRNSKEVRRDRAEMGEAISAIETQLARLRILHSKAAGITP